MSVSQVVIGICTGHRSDIDDGDDGRNPLGWTLASLAAQTAPIDRVRILKEAPAAPAFFDLVRRFEDDLPIFVEVCEADLSLGARRNRLVELAGDSALYIVDDDAILVNESTLSRQLEAFEESGDDVGALQAPVLRRSVRPRDPSAGAAVATIDWSRGEVTFGFDTARNADRAGMSFAPTFAIDHLCLAQTLVNARAVRAVGGFTTFPWPAVYGQESELAVRLARDGFRVVFLPDEEAAIVHLKYGAPHWTGTMLDDRVLAGGISFKQAAVSAAESAAVDGTFSRKTSAGFFADFVSGFGAVFAHGGNEPQQRFLANVARRFVAENAIAHPFVMPIDDVEARESAFQEGIRRLSGAGLLQTDADVRTLLEESRASSNGDGVMWI
jgi:hypothetical protein